MTLTVKLAFGSILVGLLVLGLKSAAFLMTGSIAFYSDALESVINVAAAVAALLALSFSAKPADANHPYGHHKAEYFSAVLEGVLIVLAALAILREAYVGFMDPKPLDLGVEGILVNALASGVNAAWATLLIRHGRKVRSPALIADGRHLYADVVSSIGVIAGVVLAKLTGWAVLDPLLAALVAVNILWSGWGLVTHSIGGLMDAAPPPDELERIREIISGSAQGAIEAHDVRTRNAGQVTFIDFHLVVDGEMSVNQAHEICDRIETALKHELGPAVISIHVEPHDKAKHSGVLVL